MTLSGSAVGPYLQATGRRKVGGYAVGGVRRKRRVAKRKGKAMTGGDLVGGMDYGGARRRKRKVGGVKRRKPATRASGMAGGRKRKPVAHKRGAGAVRANPWLAHLKKVYNANPHLSYGQAMKVASKSYRG